MESFLFEQVLIFRVESLCDFQPLCLVPRGGARGQNLGQVEIYIYIYIFFHFSYMGSFVFEQKILLRYYLELKSGYRVQCPRVGLGDKI